MTWFEQLGFSKARVSIKSINNFFAFSKKTLLFTMPSPLFSKVH